MALYTREHAKTAARIAKKETDYFIVVATSDDFKKIYTRTYPLSRYKVEDVKKVFKRELNVEPFVIHSDALRRRFPFVNNLKDLEDTIYMLVNGKIQEDKSKRKNVKKAKKDDSVQDILKGTHQDFGDAESEVADSHTPEIYFANVGYNGVMFRFYVKVRETDKSIWLQRIGKKQVGGDWQNAQVLPDIGDKLGKVFRRNKGNGSIKIDDYEYASQWKGQTLQEYSD